MLFHLTIAEIGAAKPYFAGTRTLAWMGTREAEIALALAPLGVTYRIRHLSYVSAFPRYALGRNLVHLESGLELVSFPSQSGTQTCLANEFHFSPTQTRFGFMCKRSSHQQFHCFLQEPKRESIETEGKQTWYPLPTNGKLFDCTFCQWYGGKNCFSASFNLWLVPGKP